MLDATLVMAFASSGADGGFRAALVLFSHQTVRNTEVSSPPFQNRSRQPHRFGSMPMRSFTADFIEGHRRSPLRYAAWFFPLHGILCGGKMMIETDRLLLRRWIEKDRKPFFRLNSDARVMEFMANCLSRSKSDLPVDHIEDHFRKHSFGLYALALRKDHSYIGLLVRSS